MSTALPPQHPFEQVRNAKAAALAERANALVSVTEGWLTIWDVITTAGTEEGKHLLRLRLHSLLLAQPGWGAARSERAIRLAAQVTGYPTQGRSHVRDLRLSWVLDARVGGNRVLALADALRAHPPTPPWPGFPYTPPDPALSQITGGPR